MLFIVIAKEGWNSVSFVFWGAFGWAKEIGILIGILFTIFFFSLAYLNTLFWFNRMRRIDAVVHTGDSIVVIPLIAEYLKTKGENIRLNLSIINAMASVLFLLSAFTGVIVVNEDGNFILYLLILLAENLIIFFISLLIMISYRFVAETIRIRAEICNNLRDVADIHRAAAILPDAGEGGVNTNTSGS